MVLSVCALFLAIFAIGIGRFVLGALKDGAEDAAPPENSATHVLPARPRRAAGFRR